jgi:hypothetical protein
LIEQLIDKVMATVDVQAETLSIELARAQMHDRDEIAKRHGFQSHAELLAISEALPMLPGDVKQIYTARHPDGRWFIWLEDTYAEPPLYEL